MIDSYGFAGFPRCDAHDGIVHRPARVVNEGRLVGVVHEKVEKVKAAIPGTLHMGSLHPQARERRRIKNLRNRSRKHPIGAVHHHDMPVAGSQRR